MPDQYFNEWEDREVHLVMRFRVRTKKCDDYDNDVEAADASARIREDVERMATYAPYMMKFSRPGSQVVWASTTIQNAPNPQSVLHTDPRP